MNVVAGPNGAAASSRRMLRRSILASVTGTALEWYDFYLYGTAAALVFHKIFFPEFDPVTGTLFSFATYAVGFGARPIGGFIAGHFGDRWGRKAVLVVTVSAMGVATFLMGLLPTYSSVGVAAPIMLVCLRLLQGIGLGGEWAGGALLIAERAPRDRRGFWTSFVQVGVPAGSLMSTGILTLLSSVLDEEQFLTWGWRIPFLFSAVIILVALVIRAKVTETPAFLEKAAQTQTTTRPKSPAIQVWRRVPKRIVQVVGIRLGADICYYTFVVFVITYVTTFLGLPESVALRAVLIAGIVELFLYPVWGILSDRFGRKRISLVGLAGCAVWAVVFFLLLGTKSPALIVVAVLVGLFFEAAMFGVQASWICELFETDVRYSGASIGYQSAAIVGGSLAPLIGVLLLREFDSPWPVVGYLLAGLAVTLVAVMTTPETRGRALDQAIESDTQERGRTA